MAAFIIAIRGTVSQAILLGVAAAFSHSLIVWVLALTALTYGDQMIAEDLEPWFILVSGVIIMAIALWVFWQAWRARRKSQDHHAHDHYDHDHDHDHAQITRATMPTPTTACQRMRMRMPALTPNRLNNDLPRAR